MKKGILAIIVAVAVVGGAFFAFKTMKSSSTGQSGTSGQSASTSSKVEQAVTEVLMPKGQVAIADVVPSDAVVFVSARNARSTWDLVKNSNFWIQASALKVWETAQLGTGFAVFKEQFKTNMGFEFTEETLFGLFGQDFSLALVSGKEGLGNPQLLILAQTDPNAGMKGKFDAIIEKVKANATVEVTEYNGQKMTRVRNPQAPGPEFNYAFIGDLFVLGVGTDDSGVRSVVDLVAKKTTNSLSTSDQYKEAVGTLKVRGDLRGVVFVNMSKVVEMLKSLPTPEGTPAGFAAGLEQSLGAIKSIAAAIGFDHGMLVKLFFAKNKEGQSSQLLAGWDSEPKEAKSVSFLPEDSLLLSVTNSLDFSSIWESWQKNLESQSPDQAKAINDAVAAFEKDSGLSVKNDILPLLGDELCFAITSVDMGGLFPFPHIAILAKVNDESKALATMQKLSDYAVKSSVPAGVTPAAEGEAQAPAPSVKSGKEAYNGTDINFLEIQLPFQSLNPSYSVSKGFLMIGINKETVKSVLDVASGSKGSVVKSKAYQDSTVNFSSKVNQVAFLNMDKTVALVIEITKWANNLQKARGETSAQADQVIQDNVLPFLETMKVFKAIALEAVNKDHGIEETVYLQMEDLKEK
jgi:hypothetical protein